jgi:hypothetical protein
MHSPVLSVENLTLRTGLFARFAAAVHKNSGHVNEWSAQYIRFIFACQAAIFWRVSGANSTKRNTA